MNQIVSWLAVVGMVSLLLALVLGVGWLLDWLEFRPHDKPGKDIEQVVRRERALDAMRRWYEER